MFRIRLSSKILLLIITAQAFLSESAESGDVTHRNRLEASVDSFVESLLSSRDVLGLNIAIVKGNETLLAKGYGVADLDTGRPVTNTTLFGLASLSKAFAATLLGKVFDDHR